MGAFSKRRIRSLLLRYAIGRLLYFEFWFRIACLAFLLLFIFLGLFLPRIWTVSPAGFLPQVRVSGLDLVQAHSLRRSAQRAVREGQYERAHYTWLAAIANNAADPALIRGALQCYLLDPDARSRTETALQQVFWLLRLAQTNQMSLELAAEVFAKARQPNIAINLFRSLDQPMTPGVRAAYLIALFEEEQFAEFGRACAEWESTLPRTAELALYRAAYVCGWGDPGQTAESRELLRDTMADPDLCELAARLQLKVACHHLDADRSSELLEFLRSQHADRLEDHLRFWDVLTTLGRRRQALDLARSASHTAESIRELSSLADFFWRSGEPSRALHALRQHAQLFGHSAPFWILFGGKLLEAQQWDEAERIAFQIRHRPALADLLAPFSYFLEGQSALAQQRAAAAERAFSKMLEWEFQTPELGLAAASHLLQWGASKVALDVLRKLEPGLQDRLEYWLALFEAGRQLKDSATMLTASRRALPLRPHDPVIRNHHAAASLAHREPTSETVALTFGLLSEYPRSVVARINHGAALLMNNRLDEAEGLLHEIPDQRLTRAEVALLNLNRFELELRRNRAAQARQWADQIDPELLYPRQKQWLETALTQLNSAGEP